MEHKEVPLTQHAFDKLQAELDFREGEKRQQIVEAIATARAHGDLSENSEYHASREEQGKNESEILRIRQMIENAVIIQDAHDDVVHPGKVVTFRYDGDEPETYLLGHREEKRDNYEVLTPESPVGQALVGHRVGDVVKASTPRGEIKVEVLEIRSL